MKKRSNMLCVISLICMFGGPVISYLVTSPFANGDISASTHSALQAGYRINIVAYIAAWVIAIVTRRKYKDKFSKVLIIIYSILLVVVILAIVLFIAVLMGMA